MTRITNMASPRRETMPLLLAALLIYLPLQSFLPEVSVAVGLNLMNILILILFLTTTHISVPLTSSYKTIGWAILLWMGFSFFSSMVNSNVIGWNHAFAFWKRIFAISLIFIIAYRILDNKHTIFAALCLISLAVTGAAIEFLHHSIQFRFSNYSDSLRYGGIFGAGGINSMGAFFAINFFWFVFWFYEQKGVRQWLAALGGLLVAVSCLFSYSRGAYLGLCFGILWFGLRKSRILFGAIIILICTIPLWAPEPVKDRLNMLTDQKRIEQDASAQHRLLIWTGAKRIIADHPIIGIGPGNFRARIEQYADLPPDGPRACHNMYLMLAAETGIVGGGLFLVILALLFREGLALARETDDWRSSWAHAYLGSLIAIIIINVFGNHFTREELTGYIWITSAMTFRIRSLAEKPSYDHDSYVPVQMTECMKAQS